MKHSLTIGGVKSEVDVKAEDANVTGKYILVQM